MDEEMSPEFKRAAQPGFDAILRWLGATKTNTQRMPPVAAKRPLHVHGKAMPAKTERRALAS
jgi:hypothetical protein